MMRFSKEFVIGIIILAKHKECMNQMERYYISIILMMETFGDYTVTRMEHLSLDEIFGKKRFIHALW